MTTDGPHEDWIAVLAGLEKGDPEAVERVTAVITGWLAHCRAYDRRDSWEDITHEVLIKLIDAVKRRKIRKPSAFVSFVGTCTRRELLDWIDRERRAAGSGDEWEALEAEAQRFDLEWILDLKEAIKGLPDELRRVMELITQGYRYQEAARLLDLPLGTFKRRLTQAREQISKKMRKR